MQEELEIDLDKVGFVEKSRVRVMDLVCGISAALALLSAFFGGDSIPYAASLVGLAGIFLITLLFKLNSGAPLSRYFVPLATTVWIIYMCIAFGSELGTQNYLVIALVAFAIFSKNNTYRAVSILVIVSTAVYINIYQQNHLPIYPLPGAVHFLFAINVLTPLIIIALICWSVIKDANKSNSIIQQQKKALEASNQFKDKMLSIISHDMRSPFNSAKGLLYLLENDMLSKNEQQTLLHQLHVDIDLSLQTLDNILGWASQAYYGAVMNAKTKMEPLDLNMLIESTIATFNQLAVQKEIKLVNSISPLTHVWADEQQIRFVLRNLTSNALKFSPSGQPIHYSAQEKNDTITISIKDQGTGMTPQMLSSLFQINQRFSRPGTANEKGSGLGLIFCKEFIENNEGSIWIESSDQQGTTVHFTLKSHSKGSK
ncbi:MAG: HAMP domain-containing sensor histidine kinase [Pedobacter sp.]|jgi:signal transduction histidine kinase|uniref:sensor histidine kinase n=1 Tax=Pedobacter sp. TaxID=1411316 RepID=UPI00356A0049